MRFIGIDPGLSGGLAMLNDKGQALEAVGMPDTEVGLWLLLCKWSNQTGREPLKAYLEKVRASPQMSKGSIWTFAQGYGSLRAFLIAAGIPFEDVAPQRWQRFVGVRDKTGARELKDVDITAKKNRHKDMAQKMFRSVPVTHKLADALLIAEYGRRLERGFGAELPS